MGLTLDLDLLFLEIDKSTTYNTINTDRLQVYTDSLKSGSKGYTYTIIIDNLNHLDTIRCSLPSVSL